MARGSGTLYPFKEAISIALDNESLLKINNNSSLGI